MLGVHLAFMLTQNLPKCFCPISTVLEKKSHLPVKLSNKMKQLVLKH